MWELAIVGAWKEGARGVLRPPLNKKKIKKSVLTEYPHHTDTSCSCRITEPEAGI